MAESDPSRIRSLALSREDVIDAFAYNRENPATAVLRVTPPFHGRMRARLHVSNERSAETVWRDGATGSIHIEPKSLLEQDVVDAYPVFEELYASMNKSEGNGGSVSEVHEHYERRLEEWRQVARNRVLDVVVLEGDGTDTLHRIDLKWLG